MTIELFTLKTTVVADTADEADDLDNATIIRPFVGGAYNLDQLHTFAAQVRASARETLIRASVIVAQIRKETANFRFGGQVPASAFNFAGIGAVNGGAAGRSFKDIPTGVKAVFAHHMNYLVGKRALWPARWDGYRELAVRNKEVVDKGYGGVVATIGDYTNGRWAWSPQYPEGSLDNGYATSIAALANEMRASSSVLTREQLPVIVPTERKKPMNGKQRTDHLIATLRARGREVIDRRGLNPVNRSHPYGQVRGGLGGVTKIVQHWTGDGFNRATIRTITGTDYGLDTISAAMSVADEIDLLNWYANYHISKDGGTWGGIAYGITIFPSGRIYVNWDIGTLTYHAFSVNGYSYALCFPSSQNQGPTPACLLSANHVWYYLCEETPEIPAGWADLLGHNECKALDGQNQTSCPGVAMTAQVQRARAQAGPTVTLSLDTAGTIAEGIGKTPITPVGEVVNPSALKLDVPELGERWIIEPILSTWREAGGVFGNPNAPGYPRSGMYADPADPARLIQWFDRARIEVKGDQVSFGLVGLEAAQAAGKAA